MVEWPSERDHLLQSKIEIPPCGKTLQKLVLKKGTSLAENKISEICQLQDYYY